MERVVLAFELSRIIRSKPAFSNRTEKNRSTPIDVNKIDEREKVEIFVEKVC